MKTTKEAFFRHQKFSEKLQKHIDKCEQCSLALELPSENIDYRMCMKGEILNAKFNLWTLESFQRDEIFQMELIERGIDLSSDKS